MQFNRKFLILSILVAILALPSWKLAALVSSEEAVAGQDEKQDKKDKNEKAFKSLSKTGGKETPIIVSASPTVRGDLIQTVSAQGRVFAYQQVELFSEVSGRLLKLNVRDGSKVKKGDLIAQIDDREYALAVQEAEGSYLQAQAEYMQYDNGQELETPLETDDSAMKELTKKLADGLVTQTQFNSQKFALEMKEMRSGSQRLTVASAKTLGKADIARQKARINLEKCSLRAPFSGVIFGLEVSEGEFLSSSTKITQLVNMTDLVVKAKVLESEIGQVFQDRRARVKFTALPDLMENEGKVQAISPFVDDTNKTVETVLAIKSTDGRIRPGMFAEAKIDARIFEDRLMVPKTAILPRDDRKVVFKVSPESRAKWEYVTTGVENDDYVEIVEGNLTAGDMVLTDNHFTMGHDTLVKIANGEK